jgi:hypothetical protein
MQNFCIYVKDGINTKTRDELPNTFLLLSASAKPSTRGA